MASLVDAYSPASTALRTNPAISGVSAMVIFSTVAIVGASSHPWYAISVPQARGEYGRTQGDRATRATTWFPFRVDFPAEAARGSGFATIRMRHERQSGLDEILMSRMRRVCRAGVWLPRTSPVAFDIHLEDRCVMNKSVRTWPSSECQRALVRHPASMPA